jgi:glutamate-1-semialdehyde 2,1-aminomutase
MSPATITNTDVNAALAEVRVQYATSNPKSLAQYVEACAVFPGGNTRTVLYYSPFPLTMTRGEGSYLWDADGHRYIDFLGEYTAALFGHSHPVIRAAIDNALDGGIDLGGHNRLEAKFASVVCARFPSIELVRFTNSGTEANLMSISAACAITNRKKVMVFNGGYHGGVFFFTGGGNPINAPFSFVVARYNDLDGTMALLEENANELGAVIIEPMMGVAGCLPAEAEFLQALRDATRKHGIILIFDEVMTSRLSPGGLQEQHGILPDITTLGKYIGGGMSFGAFGGRSEIMEHFDPRRPNSFPHAGTFNNNVLTMSAGHAAMTQLYTPEVAKAHNARGDTLRERLNELVKKKDVNMQFTGMGSMLAVHMQRGPIRTPADTEKGNVDLRDLFFFDLLSQGIWVARRGMIILSLTITEGDLEAFVAAVDHFTQTRRALLA